MAYVKQNTGPSGSQSGCKPGEHSGWAILQTQPHAAAEHMGVERPTETVQEPATCYWSLPMRSAKQMLNFKD